MKVIFGGDIEEDREEVDTEEQFITRSDFKGTEDNLVKAMDMFLSVRQKNIKGKHKVYPFRDEHSIDSIVKDIAAKSITHVVITGHSSPRSEVKLRILKQPSVKQAEFVDISVILANCYSHKGNKNTYELCENPDLKGLEPMGICYSDPICVFNGYNVGDYIMCKGYGVGSLIDNKIRLVVSDSAFVSREVF